VAVPQTQQKATFQQKFALNTYHFRTVIINEIVRYFTRVSEQMSVAIKDVAEHIWSFSKTFVCQQSKATHNIDEKNVISVFPVLQGNVLQNTDQVGGNFRADKSRFLRFRFLKNLKSGKVQILRF